jgi:hypothetical protein
VELHLHAPAHFRGVMLRLRSNFILHNTLFLDCVSLRLPALSQMSNEMTLARAENVTGEVSRGSHTLQNGLWVDNWRQRHIMDGQEENGTATRKGKERSKI